ncbi:MAG: hypothetical protein V4671_17855, partial [Armatimonadota bacterium]
DNFSQIRLFDVSNDGPPIARGVLPAKAEQGSSQSDSRSSGFSLLAAAEQMVKSAFGVSPAVSEAEVRFTNLQKIAASGNYLYVTCSAKSEKKNASPGGLCVVDISDPDQPQVVGSVAFHDAEKVVVVPGRSLVAVLNKPKNGLAYTLIDVSNPTQPQVVATQKLSHGNVLTATQDYLYIATSSGGGGYGSDSGLRVVDIRNPRAPRLAGSVPVPGYYGIEHMVAREGYVYVSVRYGRMHVIDVRDPDKPLVVRELAPSYINGLAIVGDLMYSGIGSAVALWSLQVPERPSLIGTPPSAATLGYMKRRARRLLRNLAKTDPALFTSLAAQVFTEPGKATELDWAANWISIDLLFGEGGRLDQVSHGRGRMLETRPAGLRIRRREERGRTAWEAHPEKAAAVFTGTNAPWQAREMTLRILRATGRPVPALPGKLLPACLSSPSLLLIAEAVRQSVVLAQSSAELKSETAAEAFVKASARQRTLLLPSILARAAKNEMWGRSFTTDLLQRIPDAPPDGRRPTRRSIAILTALFEHLGDSVVAAKGSPVLRLIPMLMSSGLPLLRDQAIRAAQSISPEAAVAWLPTLTKVTESADREQLLSAMEGALRGTSMTSKVEDSFRQILLDNLSTTAAWGWRLLEAVAAGPNFLRSLWTILLSDTTLQNALETAMSSPQALTLLGRSGITNDEMSTYLQERPQLIGLLSAQSFAVLTQTMPAPVTLRMIASATDEAWTRLREGWLRNLREGIGINALWTSAEEALKADETGNLERRLIDDGEVAVTIRDADDTAGVLAIREPVMAAILGDYVRHHLATIAASDALLLTAATHPLPDVRDTGLEALADRTIRLPMALGLLESEVPASIAAGRRWFADTAEPDLLTRALALCDSPVASVRAIGRDFVAERRDQLPVSELSEALVEHADPKMQAFAARMLGTEPAPQFDREVLRTRNRSRDAKELVKTRQEAMAAADNQGAVDTPTLLALARGATTPRDSEWALTLLVQRAMAGETIEGLTIEGAAAAAPGER